MFTITPEVIQENSSDAFKGNDIIEAAIRPMNKRRRIFIIYERTKCIMVLIFYINFI